MFGVKSRVAAVFITAGAPVFAAAAAPAAAARHDLSASMPEQTLLYIGWAGADPAGGEETALSKLLDEPEMQRLKEELWPALDQLISKVLDEQTELPLALYDDVKWLLGLLRRSPVAIDSIDVGMGEMGPQVELALVVKAGRDADALAERVEKMLALAEVPAEEIEESQVGEFTFKVLPLPPPVPPVRWGVVDGHFIITVGEATTEKVIETVGGSGATLAKSERFAAAMKSAGSSDGRFTLFLDLKAVVKTLEAFGPMFAAMQVPIIGEEGGLASLLDQLEVGALESLSLTVRQQAGGYRGTMFLHAPGEAEGLMALYKQKPITDDDLAVVPTDATWFYATNFDVSAAYQNLVKVIEGIAPDAREEFKRLTAPLEEKHGISIERDIIEAFDDGWVFFDAPSNGGLWFTGITLAVEVKSAPAMNATIEKIAEALEAELGINGVEVKTETYRDHEIRFINTIGLPIPVAPAWAFHDNRMIVALYPQMLRTTLDRLIDGAETILSNPDFQRGRKLLPENAHSIGYGDTAAAVRSIYRFALPIAQVGAAMLQGEADAPIDIGMLPSSRTLTKHLFGQVTAAAWTDEGLLTVSHGVSPVPMGLIGVESASVPLVAMGVAVALPSLARARMLAKRTASVANLHLIGAACYIYANDHEGKLPPDLLTLLESNAIREKTLQSPFDEPGNVSYVYIAGQTTANDPRNVLAYEKPELHDNEGTNVLHIDAHVSWEDMAGFEKDLAETNRRLGRAADAPGAK